jgi:hypothetical protein
LKLYLYGYTNQIRSSRRLEREAGRNLERIWLLKNLRLGYRTIANFRKENWAALKVTNRSTLTRDAAEVGFAWQTHRTTFDARAIACRPAPER